MKTGDIVLNEVVPGSSREAIALFSQATEDPNPIHVDAAFAASCGFPQVLQQGPMTTAHFARLLANAVGEQSVKMIDVTFMAPVFPMELLRFVATFSGVDALGVTRLDLQATKVDGTVTARGTAEVALL